MKNNIVRRLPMAAAITAAIGATMGPASAQTETPSGQPLETVTVTGIRTDLTESRAMKRNADDIRDVITSLEVGGLPDQNIAEALQRLPGISITRSQGEGRFVSVRGLPPEFTRVTINNMTSVSTDNGRAVPLDLFSSDLFATLEVIKTPTAADSTGGIGGTINLSSANPMSLDGLTANAEVSAFYNDLSQEWGPKLSASIGNVLADGTLGVMAGVAYSDRDIRQDTIFSGGWNPVADFFSDAPETIADASMWENGQLRLFQEQRERLGAYSSVRFEPDEVQSYGLSLIYSEYTIDQTKYQFLHRFKKGSDISDVELQGDTVTRATFTNASPGSNNQRRTEENESLVLSGDAHWDLDQWQVSVEGGYSEADVTVPEDLKYVWDGTATFGYDLSDPYQPEFNFAAPLGQDAYTDPTPYDTLRQVVVEKRDVGADELRLAGSVERLINAGFLSSVEAGIEYRSRSKNQLSTQYKDRSSPKTDTGVNPLSDYNDTLSIDNYFGGDYPFWNNLVVDFDAARSGLVPAGGFEFPKDLLNSYDIGEDILAGYMLARLETDSGSGNVGVRFVSTETTANGYGSFNGADPEPVTFDGDYTEVLPSATYNFHLSEQLIWRLSASKTLVRPDFRDMAPRQSVNEVELTISQGNPELDPYTAMQMDTSVEYYFQELSLVSAALFHKDIDSFIFDQTRTVQLTNPSNYGVSTELQGEEFNISQPINGDGAQITGVELNLQHSFDNIGWLRGWGVNANVTYADSDAEFNANLRGLDIENEGGRGSQEFPLPGLSEWTYNAQIYYENYGFTGRLAYNHRSEFLITPAGQEGDPEYVAPYGQLDAYVSYALGDRFTVYAEAMNLNNEPLRAYTSKEPRLLEYSESGIRLFAGVKFQF